MPNGSTQEFGDGPTPGPPTVASPFGAQSDVRSGATPDGIVAGAARWIAKDEHLTELQLTWQNLETAMFEKKRAAKRGRRELTGAELPEVRAMQALDFEIRRAIQELETDAGEIRQKRATTVLGAIAKIELGMKVQGPFDWRDHALELLEDGLADLRAQLKEI